MANKSTQKNSLLTMCNAVAEICKVLAPLTTQERLSVMEAVNTLSDAITDEDFKALP